MARLPRVSNNVVLTQAPQSTLSQADIANPYMAVADAFGAIGTKLEEHEITKAGEEGENAVYRDESGALKVDLRSNYSKAGQAYNRAATQGFTARLAGDIRSKGTSLANEAQGDVNLFGSSWKGFSDTLLKSVPQQARGAVATMLDTEGSRLGLGVSEQKRQRDIRTYEGNIKAEINSLDDEMATLARAGGTGTTDYQEKQSQIRSLYGELAANPEFSVGDKEAQIAVKRLESRHTSEAMLGHIDRTLATGGVRAAREQADRILTDTALELSPSERRQYSGLANEAIRSWGAQRKVELEPVKEKGKKLRALLDEGIGIDSSDIDDTARMLAAGGDMGGALELYSARSRARQLQAFRSTGDADQVAALERGRAAGSSANTGARGGALTRAMPGNIRKTVSDAAVRYGQDPHDLLVITMLESGGNPNAKNPSSSAGGLHQFIDGTAADYNLADRFDPGQSSDAAARLMRDNREALEAVLGRKPTTGELYLAHQQGAGGAVKLLGNPDALAADLVGAEAVRLNGGREDMTAREFAGLWMKKAGDIVVTSGPDIDPEVVKEMRAEVTSDAKDMWDDMRAGMEKNMPPSTEEVGLLSRQLALIDDEDFRGEVTRFFENEAGASIIAELPQDQAAAIISALKSDASAGATIAQQELLAAAERGAEQRAEALKADPVGYAVDRRLIDPVPAIDLAGGPDVIGTAFTARQHAVDLLRARGEVGVVSALRPEDEKMLGQFIQTATPAEQAQLLGSMAGSLKPGTFLATMAGLAEKSDTSAMATAGALYNENPEVAEGILRGTKLLRENAKLAPANNDDNREDIDTILPPGSFAPGLEGSRQKLLEAATARYADLSNLAGDTTGELNQERMSQSVNEVTGGMLDMNGSPFIAPRYGMSQSELDGVLASLTDSDLIDAVTSEGQPITARDFRTYGRLKAVGADEYLLEFGPADMGTFAMTRVTPAGPDDRGQSGGGPFTIRLGDR